MTITFLRGCSNEAYHSAVGMGKIIPTHVVLYCFLGGRVLICASKERSFNLYQLQQSVLRIFENQSYLASNSRASFRKSLAILLVFLNLNPECRKTEVGVTPDCFREEKYWDF